MTFAYPLPIGYQNLINSLTKHMLKDVVSGLSRRKHRKHLFPTIKSKEILCWLIDLLALICAS
jgi:hypothetical protein